ncbi:MAG: hypothetical protein KIT33_09485 [Candidatus Kapabacteria bacterium]|nr:hypothetical protein [Ignavibacteriota bacterium]MCW5885189.1 hypothetical protein [Candidatus Kapabacteria bacterium]
MKNIILILFALTFFSSKLLSYNPEQFHTDYNEHLLKSLRKAVYNDLGASKFTIDYELTEYFLNSDPVKIYGFIGNELERIRVKINDVKLESKSAGRYIIKGKTKVKNNISEFAGHLQLKSVYEFKEPVTSHWLVMCRFSAVFKEIGSGSHKGEFTGDYYIILSKIVDELRFAKAIPQFAKNHTFVGNWKSSDNKLHYPVLWGEDIMIEELEDVYYGITINPSVDDSKLEKSWKSFFDAFNYDNDEKLKENAMKIETEKWWE